MEFILVLRSVMYRLGAIASRVVWNADKVLYPIGQVFGFLGKCSWRPATAGLLRFSPHLEPAAASSSLVAPASAVRLLLVAAVSSEIANAAVETALMADVNSGALFGHVVLIFQKLIMLLLLGGGELAVLEIRVRPGFDSGHHVNLFLGHNSL
jgi:hypothetical protein